MLFDWDDAKHRRTLRERGFGFDIAGALFAGPVVVFEDRRNHYGERRMVAHGHVDGRRFICVYTDRDDGTVRWIISLRKANRREIERIHVPQENPERR